MNKNEGVIKYTLKIQLLLVIIVFLSYSWIYKEVSSTKTNYKRTDNLTLELKEDEETIYINDLKNIKDNDSYKFHVTNRSESEKNYTLYLDDVKLDGKETRLDSKNINYYIYKDNIKTNPNTLSNLGDSPNRKLDSSTIAKDTTSEYIIKFYLKDKTKVKSTDVIKLKVRIEENN